MLRMVAVGICLLALLSPCVGLAVVDDKDIGVDSIGRDGSARYLKQAYATKDASFQRRVQSKAEYGRFRKQVRMHTETRGGAFAGHIPEHLFEHVAMERTEL
jgi:hypothetical protein